MGNRGSNSRGRRRNATEHVDASPQPPPSENPLPDRTPQEPSAGGNRYVFAAATPFPAQFPNPAQYHNYTGYYQPPFPAPFIQHHGHPQMPPHVNWSGGRLPYGGAAPLQPVVPYVEHQKAVTIRNVVNLKKESLRVEPDEGNPGRFLVAFTYDATVTGSITVMFFAKEGLDCILTPMRESLLQPVTVSFEAGLGQKFMQPSGTGIDFSAFEDVELLKEGEMEIYPLAIKAEAFSTDGHESVGDNEKTETPNSQITQAVFEKKENGEYYMRVVKQILWVGSVRYELQEIYGIGNSVDNDLDTNDPGKDCVICLSEPRDTTVLPCRHMCMCSQCAKVLRFRTNRCPICRQPVERLLEIKVNNKTEEQGDAVHTE